MCYMCICKHKCHFHNHMLINKEKILRIHKSTVLKVMNFLMKPQQNLSEWIN